MPDYRLMFAVLISVALHAAFLVMGFRVGEADRWSALPFDGAEGGRPPLIVRLGATAAESETADSDIDHSSETAQDGVSFGSGFGNEMAFQISPAVLDRRLLYLPAAELDVRPKPEVPVVVPFPETSLEQRKRSLKLLLYISETGQVDDAEIVESELPEAFGNSARATFIGIRMAPGYKNGVAVPSRLKIQVDYEDSTR